MYGLSIVISIILAVILFLWLKYNKNESNTSAFIKSLIIGLILFAIFAFLTYQYSKNQIPEIDITNVDYDNIISPWSIPDLKEDMMFDDNLDLDILTPMIFI